MDSSKKQVEDFSDLFYRPKPRQVGLQGDSCNKLNHPSMRDDTQPQPPTPNLPADASGASTEELLQTLNLLSLQCTQFSNSILEMMDLHVTKLQKLIGELRENVIAERENCATLWQFPYRTSESPHISSDFIHAFIAFTIPLPDYLHIICILRYIELVS